MVSTLLWVETKKIPIHKIRHVYPLIVWLFTPHTTIDYHTMRCVSFCTQWYQQTIWQQRRRGQDYYTTRSVHLHYSKNRPSQMISIPLSWQPADRYYVVSVVQIRKRGFYIFWMKRKKKKYCGCGSWGQFYLNWLLRLREVFSAYLMAGFYLDLFQLE